MSETTCAICGADLSGQAMVRQVEITQRDKSANYYQDEVYDLCPEHYAAISRLFVENNEETER